VAAVDDVDELIEQWQPSGGEVRQRKPRACEEAVVPFSRPRLRLDAMRPAAEDDVIGFLESADRPLQRRSPLRSNAARGVHLHVHDRHDTVIITLVGNRFTLARSQAISQA
jgi:hypothetical protein